MISCIPIVEPLRPHRALFFCLFFVNCPLSITYDFTVIGRTQVPGISLIVAHNEDAFNYLTEEEELTCFADGSVPLDTDKVGDFISDAGWEHYSCELV